MRFYTVHAEPPPLPPAVEGWPAPKGRPPVLLRDGFSLAAFCFGVFWFLWNRLWWEALALAVLTAGALLLPGPVAPLALLVLHLLAGFEARDRLRERLARRGLPMQGVVAARDLDLAWFRLGQQRPDLVRAVP